MRGRPRPRGGAAQVRRRGGVRLGGAPAGLPLAAAHAHTVAYVVLQWHAHGAPRAQELVCDVRTGWPAHGAQPGSWRGRAAGRALSFRASPCWLPGERCSFLSVERSACAVQDNLTILEALANMVKGAEAAEYDEEGEPTARMGAGRGGGL